MTLHVIGAGVAGLACAVSAASTGIRVILYEASGNAGGRTRSFHDKRLGATIDNGSHLLLSANHATIRYLSTIGSEHHLLRIEPAVFPFIDIGSGERWCLRPGSAVPPLWLMSPTRRVPGRGPVAHVLQIIRLLQAGNHDTVADVLEDDLRLYGRLWKPLTLAVMNTDPDEAAASVMKSLVRRTFLRGEKYCRPMIFARGLTATLVDPAVAFLRARGTELKVNSRVGRIEHDDRTATALRVGQENRPIGPDDAVVLAAPPPHCNRLWSGVSAPADYRTIVNVHFLLAEPPRMPWNIPFLGMVGGHTHWLFLRDNILSATISAAGSITAEPAPVLSSRLWSEIRRALSLPQSCPPPSRIIKERRATLAQTPYQVSRRSGTRTSLDNLFLAGDWTDTRLPATIEGAVQSGFRAADLAVASIIRARR